MEPTLYQSIGGGRADFKKQELIANNLANINTPGFRADLFSASLQYSTNADGSRNTTMPAMLNQGENGIDLTPGEIMTTGRDLDVAIDGDGWMAVKDKQGAESYVRGGSLRVDPNGQLITSSGKAVMGNGGPISIPPVQSIEIASDGTISIIPLEGDVTSLAVLDRIKLVSLDKNNIVKNSEGLVQQRNGNPAAVDGKIKLLSGALENSNVNAIDQMVSMISAGREFDSHMKIMTTVDDNAEKLARLLQL